MNTASEDQSSLSRPLRAIALVALLAIALSVLLRLSAYGIWDPWELSVADAARKLGEGASEGGKSLSLRLVQASFALFGTREWAGRLPMALSGLGLLLASALWVRRYSGTRPALYTVLVLGTTPLFLLHSREMVGATPALLASALTAIGASNAVFRVADSERAWASYLWLALALLGGLLGAFTSGVLLSVLPALGAVAASALLSGVAFDRAEPRESRIAAWAVIASTVGVGAFVLRAVFRHGSEYSVWTGGAPLDEAVPTFEQLISHLFHGLAPWSAIAPVALGGLLWSQTDKRDAPLRLVCLVWSALAYAAATVFLSTYGSAAFPAPIAITIPIALWLTNIERREDTYYPELIIVLLMLGLIVRDFALYPASPLEALALANAQVPDKFNPKLAWALCYGLFGAGLVLSCIATRERAPLDLRAPYKGLRQHFQRGGGHQGWVIFAGLVWLGLIVYGVFSIASVPGVKLSSIARRVGRVVGALALLTPLLIALAQALYHYASRLARFRNALLVIAALASGFYTSQAFLPKLSAHLSPREVFDVFEKLAGKSEPLAQFQVHGRAAAYYVQRDVRDIATESELVEYLAEPGRRWALMPSERFADVDVAFRRRTGRHLFVPSAENARVSLVASQPIEARSNENPLSKYVLKTAKTVQFPIGANFENKIELVGYDLELPQNGYVGAGQTFTVVWVYRALKGNLGAFQAFLHVDAEGQRINGDHDPVDGMYPVRLWDEGDVVVDRQRVSVPATTTPGLFTMYTGFFRGETRLKVVSGPKDDADRVIAGTIQIR